MYMLLKRPLILGMSYIVTACTVL